MFTVILMPFVVAALALPLVGTMMVLKAEDKRRSEEVRLMLAKPYGKPAPAPRAIADDAILEATVEGSAIRF